ncbi:MAG: hypothetical protein BWX80_01109 [Candidatus Hydrogenedentes bacterium ADurb.Bin101]|jgi:hypothetical protein|nr:MAG: hypothetical protein BWX80_01109 [Candidatus Hydrogenedentes bacterium ADurb.Bin101]
MKCEVKSLKWERKEERGVSNFTLQTSPFYLAATIRKNSEELRV